MNSTVFLLPLNTDYINSAQMESEESMTLLANSNEFLEQLKTDIKAAKSRIYIQAMTFEGDSVGISLSNALLDAAAEDIRVCIDDYSNHVVNDTTLKTPFSYFNRSLNNEYQAFLDLCKKLEQKDIGIRFTNRVGAFKYNFPFRNHKKICVVDDVAYIGGINFSEHNFDWEDFMVRIQDVDVANSLSHDFLTTYNGKNQSCRISLNELELYFMDGLKSRHLYQDLFSLVRQASQKIICVSPYITLPWTSIIEEKANEGVRVEIFTPEANNKSVLKHYISPLSKNNNITIQQIPERMIHMKFILIDDSMLIFGSSNFDGISYLAEQEVIAWTRNAPVISTLQQKILSPFRETSIQMTKHSKLLALLSRWAIKIACMYVKTVFYLANRKNP